MEFPTSSTRGFFEILMPGVFLLLNILLTIYLLVLKIIPNINDIPDSILKIVASPALFIVLLIVFGYPLGFVLRLLKNKNIDKLSAGYIKFLKPKDKDEYYLTDVFFYNNWMYKKSLSHLPKAASDFYKKYWYDKYSDNAALNTTFINFCKSILSKFDQNSCNEVYAAEATIRFVSGSYYALQISVLLMVLNSYLLNKMYPFKAYLITIFIILGYIVLLHVILLQYRLLRCKEVDTIFSACFANREKFKKLLPTYLDRRTITSPAESNYNVRKKIFVELWKAKKKKKELIHSVKLDELISKMKEESEDHPFLSSLYFAGSYIDHPFFIESDKIAIGISVLPEDSEKAGLKKKHPHQTEYLVVLNGTIDVFIKPKNKIEQIVLHENESYEIQKDICHWISINESCKSAAYMFIKTNPSKEPKSKEC